MARQRAARVREVHRPQRGPIGTLAMLIQVVVFFVVMVLGLAFIFGLVGVEPEANYAKPVYKWANWLLTPFRSFIGEINPVGTTSVQVPTLVGIFVYTIIAAIAEMIARAFRPDPRRDVRD